MASVIAGPISKQQLRSQLEKEEDRMRSAHHCLRGRLHLMTAMKLLIFIGMLAIVGVLVLESLYFRRAIFILLIPTLVTSSTVVAIIRQTHHLIWPIIGISFFHMFLAMYALLIFAYYFFFKPLYIIMVLNWAFDTLYTDKTPSYYLHCACIFAVLLTFFLFNLWQLRVSIGFRQFLENGQQNSPQQCSNLAHSSSSNNSMVQSAAGGFSSGCSSSMTAFASGLPHSSPTQPKSLMHSSVTSAGYAPIGTRGMLNEPPMLLLSSSGSPYRHPSSGPFPQPPPMTNYSGGERSRRSSLTESRRLAI
ncbi:hypothetical protein DdX_01106 [Ditylenchus destructor]|uniref:Transmembrane protein n=1 Tax=Ditylenchus destructor TaxID=166010 RepID=A0AAD4NI77_9BILA|nr:hypothetical protein DdX_01106 [Ditylenchus destructor]